MRGRLAGGLLAGLLGACAPVGPEYVAPPPDVPAVYAAPVPHLVEASPAAVERWWQVFGDAELDALVDRGLAGNLDIRIARSRVDEARALAARADAALAPQVDGNTEAGLESRDTSDDDRETGAFVGAGLGGAWDLDLFGGLERGSQAAWARAEAEVALEREARRLTASEIVATYLVLRAAQDRLALARSALEQEQAVRDIVGERVAAGLAPQLDLARAEAAVASLEAELGPLESEIARAGYALAVLAGQPPGSLDGALGGGGLPRPLFGAPIGVPLDLLRCRPDIQAAELAIVAATAEIGVATAALYPSLTLPGTIQLGLGSADAVTTVLAGLSLLLDVPLLDGGSRQADLDAAEARAVEATLAWRLEVLEALEEVEAAMQEYEAQRRRQAALFIAEERNREAYEQSQALYREGLATFLDVLDSQRAWIVTQQHETVARRDLALALADVYGAVGCLGPWQE